MITTSLPQKISFYGLGELQSTIPSTLPEQKLELAQAQRISFKGAPLQSIVVCAEKSFDSSMLAEIANLIASQMASYFSKKEDWFVDITPPQTVKPDTLKFFFNNQSHATSAYWFSYKKKLIPIRIFLINQKNEVIQNA